VERSVRDGPGLFSPCLASQAEPFRTSTDFFVAGARRVRRRTLRRRIMLPSQRHLFDIPREVAYLNAAAWSPLPKAVQAAGHAAWRARPAPGSST